MNCSLKNSVPSDPPNLQFDIIIYAIIFIWTRTDYKQLGIAVHDHNIVGKAGHVSLKGLKLI